MKFSQETLMAYADGELDPQTRRAVEAAIAEDPQVAQQIEQHRALRLELNAALGGVIEEPIPERLLAAVNSSPAGASTVASLSAARAAKAQRGLRRWSWPEWTSMAASLLIGILAGRSLLQQPASNGSTLVATEQGRIVASGALAHALSEQSGGIPGETSISIGLSFRAKSGEYCRAFTAQQQNTLAGFACNEGDTWRVQALEQGGPRAGGDYRMAGTQLPASILQAIGATIEGEALDADEEAAARERGWRPGSPVISH